MTRLGPALLIAAAATPVSAQPPGAPEHAEARRLLDTGGPAVEAAFRAIVRSEEFEPQAWSLAVPEGRLVLDEFTGAAAAAYRRARAGYRATLGEALAADGDAAGAETEYRRSLALDPRPETWRRLADLPGLALSERVASLLHSWTASDADTLDLLRNSGAFRTEDGLAAAFDRFRYASARRGRMPEGASPHDGAFPALTLAVEGGAWSSARAFSEGRWLLLYFPAPGCPRCGEVVDDLQTALRDRPIDLIAAVPDVDLGMATRIARLTGAGLFQPEPQTASGRSALAPRPVGHVVRRDIVAFRPEPHADETLWLAARAGLSVWRIPLVAGDSVRRAVRALFRFLDESPVPGSSRPLVEIPEGPEDLIEALGRLEAGAEPIADLEERLLAAVRSALRESGDPLASAMRLLRLTASLRVGDAARLRLLAELVPGLGERLLAAARGLDGGVARAVPNGKIRVAAGADGLLAIQREYEGRDRTRLVLAAVVRPGNPGEVRPIGLAPGSPAGVTARESGFVWDGGRCVRWGPTEGPAREQCPAEVHRGAVVVRSSQLVGEPAEGPWYRRRVDGGSQPTEAEALTEALAAFAAGEPARANAALERAATAIGPGSPIGMAAVRYNLARIEESRGNREQALRILLAIGDATFLSPLDEAIRRLYRAGPPG